MLVTEGSLKVEFMLRSRSSLIWSRSERLTGGKSANTFIQVYNQEKGSKCGYLFREDCVCGLRCGAWPTSTIVLDSVRL